jgi:periplasmic protein TonB
LKGQAQKVARAEKARATASGSTDGAVYELALLDRTPAVKSQHAPTYPYEMRTAGITGEVLVDFVIDSQGNVQKAFAAKSSRREFESAAVEAVSRWKFDPGAKGGRAVSTHMQVPIVYTLDEEDGKSGEPTIKDGRKP